MVGWYQGSKGCPVQIGDEIDPSKANLDGSSKNGTHFILPDGTTSSTNGAAGNSGTGSSPTGKRQQSSSTDGGNSKSRRRKRDTDGDANVTHDLVMDYLHETTFTVVDNITTLFDDFISTNSDDGSSSISTSNDYLTNDNTTEFEDLTDIFDMINDYDFGNGTAYPGLEGGDTFSDFTVKDEVIKYDTTVPDIKVTDEVVTFDTTVPDFNFTDEVVTFDTTVPDFNFTDEVVTSDATVPDFNRLDKVVTFDTTVPDFNVTNEVDTFDTTVPVIMVTDEVATFDTTMPDLEDLKTIVYNDKVSINPEVVMADEASEVQGDHPGPIIVRRLDDFENNKNNDIIRDDTLEFPQKFEEQFQKIPKESSSDEELSNSINSSTKSSNETQSNKLMMVNLTISSNDSSIPLYVLTLAVPTDPETSTLNVNLPSNLIPNLSAKPSLTPNSAKIEESLASIKESLSSIEQKLNSVEEVNNIEALPTKTIEFNTGDGSEDDNKMPTVTELTQAWSGDECACSCSNLEELEPEWDDLTVITEDTNYDNQTVAVDLAGSSTVSYDSTDNVTDSICNGSTAKPAERPEPIILILESKY